MTKDEFITKIVNGYIKNDIQTMINILPDHEGNGALNFPLTYCVISYMESLGSYLNGLDLKFECNIKKYVHTCMKEYSSNLNYQILGDLVRHGLGHDYFSRIPISKSDIADIFYYKDKTLALNSKSLARKFVNSLEIFSDQLNEKEFKSRADEINNRINRILNKEEVNKFIRHIKEKHNYDSKPSTFPLVSGASTPLNY